jgi:D-3-phosphoglycerate dehydrogenase
VIRILGRRLSDAAQAILDGIETDKLVWWVGLMTPEPFLLKYRPPDLIATPCTGTDHLDAIRGIPMLSLRDCGELPMRATVEHTIGLILALIRKIPAAAEHTRAGGWDRYRFVGNDLNEKLAFVIGAKGRIGSGVAKLLRNLGMRVAESDRVSATGFDGQLDKMVLGQVHLVTVHVPLDDSTRGMFGREQFAAMKPSAWFVNTSRGAVVDEAALLAALESGHLAGAALDVLCEEPPAHDHPLVNYAAANPDRLLVTPHLGGCTVESMEQAECLLARRLVEELSPR